MVFGRIFGRRGLAQQNQHPVGKLQSVPQMPRKISTEFSEEEFKAAATAGEVVYNELALAWDEFRRVDAGAAPPMPRDIDKWRQRVGRVALDARIKRLHPDEVFALLAHYSFGNSQHGGRFQFMFLPTDLQYPTGMCLHVISTLNDKSEKIKEAFAFLFLHQKPYYVDAHPSRGFHGNELTEIDKILAFYEEIASGPLGAQANLMAEVLLGVLVRLDPGFHARRISTLTERLQSMLGIQVEESAPFSLENNTLMPLRRCSSHLADEEVIARFVTLVNELYPRVKSHLDLFPEANRRFSKEWIDHVVVGLNGLGGKAQRLQSFKEFCKVDQWARFYWERVPSLIVDGKGKPISVKEAEGLLARFSAWPAPVPNWASAAPPSPSLLRFGRTDFEWKVAEHMNLESRD
jgi:hypothetical protein